MNKYKIGNNFIDIIDKEWDFLIIFNACRYDIFKDIYQNYFPSETLKMAISPTARTL
ncbi:MAG: hypothetical protein MUO82_07880 [Candidatus Thermoplasmatota archaeon]|nr:hypothetical protein [Candidatus Thermoplasmatota archaeon]